MADEEDSRRHHAHGDHRHGRTRELRDDHPSPRHRGHLPSPKRRREDHHSPTRSRGLHDAHPSSRGRASRGDDRSPRRRGDSHGRDESFSTRKDLHSADRSVRRRDLQGEEESPARRRGRLEDGELSPRRRREEEAFSRRHRDEKYHTGDHRHGGRDRRSEEGQRDSYNSRKDAGEDKGIGGLSNYQRRSDRAEEELPELYSVHRAKVQSVRPFGIFVRLEGFVKQALVHLSQLSDYEVTKRDDPDELKLQAIEAVAAEGDEVWVKVISLKQEEGNVKIGCSLKFVSQRSGQDLDPNNVKLEQKQPRGDRQEPKKATLDAIYNVVCPCCGGHGHLKTECFSSDNKHYDLLPDVDDQLQEQPQQHNQEHNISKEAAAGIPGLGRGRAMVLPAWMKHGIGASLPQALGSDPPREKTVSELPDLREKKVSELPDRVTTVEEALALIEQVKKDKRDRKHKRRHRRHRKREGTKREGTEKVRKRGGRRRKKKGGRQKAEQAGGYEF